MHLFCLVETSDIEELKRKINSIKMEYKGKDSRAVCREIKLLDVCLQADCLEQLLPNLCFYETAGKIREGKFDKFLNLLLKFIPNLKPIPDKFRTEGRKGMGWIKEKESGKINGWHYVFPIGTMEDKKNEQGEDML